MNIKLHLIIQTVLFLALNFTLGLETALIVVSFHFIPSIDFFFKKIGIKTHWHRALFHNIFVVATAAVIAFSFTNQLTASLATLNIILHIVMDLEGTGVMLIFPISEHRFVI